MKLKIKNRIFSLSITIILFFSSCATILQGSKQNISITSDPPTAKIYVDEEYLGTGHADAKLKRNQSHTIMSKQDDYITRYITVDNHLQAGWLIADILFGILPLGIDAGTGSFNAFDKNHYIIQMEKK